jgi:hypothetical protein
MSWQPRAECIYIRCTGVALSSRISHVFICTCVNHWSSRKWKCSVELSSVPLYRCLGQNPTRENAYSHWIRHGSSRLASSHLELGRACCFAWASSGMVKMNPCENVHSCPSILAKCLQALRELSRVLGKVPPSWRRIHVSVRPVLKSNSVAASRSQPGRGLLSPTAKLSSDGRQHSHLPSREVQTKGRRGNAQDHFPFSASQ